MANSLYQPRNADELRDRMLRDLRLGAIDAGLEEPPTQLGSDWHLLATMCAGPALLGFSNINAAESSANVFDATGDDLDRIRDADGLPVIDQSGSAGKIVVTILGATTIPNGTELRLPNGLRIQTVGNYINPSDQDELDVEAIDKGPGTNLASGAKVTFVTAPVNVAETAVVSDGTPLTGGTDTEGDAAKRDRILNRRRNRPAGGNWAQLREWAREARGDVLDAYVMPALGGPGSTKIVPVRKFDRENGSYTRAHSTAAILQIRSYIHARVGEPFEVVVEVPADESCDAVIAVKLPQSALSGGNGQGWTDAAPWPPVAGPLTTNPTTNDQLTVGAVTATAPVAGQTHIAWWSPRDRRFFVRLVTAQSGSSGSWLITLDSPLVDSTGEGPLDDDLISPAAYNLDAYGAAWVDALEALGTGENSDDSDVVPRALRHPYVTDEDPAGLTNTTVAGWAAKFPEITDFDATITPDEPTVPAGADDPPNILVPRHFSIIPI